MPFFFQYPQAAVAARFSQGSCDYMYLSLRVVDYGVITGIADDELNLLGIEEDAPLTHRLKLRMSTCWDPLPTMIGWLEALTRRVQSATWSFDGEGPCSDLTHAFSRFVVAVDGEERVNVAMSREQLIPALYGALRRLGTSRRYRPGGWERWSDNQATSPRTLRSKMVEDYIQGLYTAPSSSAWPATPPWLLTGRELEAGRV